MGACLRVAQSVVASPRFLSWWQQNGYVSLVSWLGFESLHPLRYTKQESLARAFDVVSMLLILRAIVVSRIKSLG